MVRELGEMLASRLDLWKSAGKHSHYPENILIYRDGVSESQYQKACHGELPRLRKGCTMKYGNQPLPKITIVVVGKRHHTRFWLIRQQSGNANGNPPNGLVVDTGITEYNWDFLLQSHAPLHGTARPTQYFVVCDEIFRSRGDAANSLETLTHNMCFLFGRATRSLSICPAVRYANIACERARKYLAHVYNAPGVLRERVRGQITLSTKLRSRLRRIGNLGP